MIFTQFSGEVAIFQKCHFYFAEKRLELTASHTKTWVSWHSESVSSLSHRLNQLIEKLIVWISDWTCLLDVGPLNLFSSSERLRVPAATIFSLEMTSQVQETSRCFESFHLAGLRLDCFLPQLVSHFGKLLFWMFWEGVIRGSWSHRPQRCFHAPIIGRREGGTATAAERSPSAVHPSPWGTNISESTVGFLRRTGAESRNTTAPPVEPQRPAGLSRLRRFGSSRCHNKFPSGHSRYCSSYISWAQ